MADEAQPSPENGKNLSYNLILAGIFVLLVIAAVVLAYKKPPFSPEDVTVVSSIDGKEAHVKLPYTKNGANNETLDFTFVQSWKTGQPTVFLLIPDDCVERFEVNGKPVVMQGDAQQHRCDWQNGFRIDLKPYLNEGKNNVYIKIRNNNGAMGLSFSMVTNQ